MEQSSGLLEPGCNLDRQCLIMKVQDALEKVCRQNFSFLEYIHVQGHLSFQTDNAANTRIKVYHIISAPSYAALPPSNGLLDVQDGQGAKKEHGSEKIPDKTLEHDGGMAAERENIVKFESNISSCNDLQNINKPHKLSSDDDSLLLPIYPINEENESPEINIVTESRSNFLKDILIQSGISESDENSSKSLKCNDCGKVSKSKIGYDLHMRRHLKNISCNICHARFNSKSSLYQHKRGKHGKENPYKCSFCLESFSFHNSLQLHLLRHSGKRPFKCHDCNKDYMTNSHLKSHIQSAHPVPNSFCCDFCNQSFDDQKELNKHKVMHTGILKYNCQCGQKFVNKSSLNRHVVVHKTSSSLWQCTDCSLSFKSESRLKNHQKKHKSLLRFVCHICGHKFMYQSNLKAHCYVHDKKKNFKCEICDKLFQTKSSLYSHALVHSDIKEFACSECNKSFKSKYQRDVHQQRHSGDKPFTCSACGNSFTEKGGLTKHIKSVHGELKRFQCPVCEKRTSRADNLRVHMLQHKDPSLLKLSSQKLLVNDDLSLSDESNLRIDVAEEEKTVSANAGEFGQTLISAIPNIDPDSGTRPVELMLPAQLVDGSTTDVSDNMIMLYMPYPDLGTQNEVEHQ